METLLRKRSLIRKDIINGVQEKATGWGVWIEAIELCDMHIMSQALFNDMQQK